ncbi:MAG: hypothetical protein NTX12_00170, partial [Actinobacteria bacterium]|nr:hypothetical protein [Actinomycetota bacterium]
TTSAGLATTCTATRVAWYQDAESYAARATLVSKYQLGGIAAWTLGMEDSTAMQAVRQVAVSIAPDLVLATISTDLTSVAYGNLVNVNGTFQRMDGTPIAGLTAHLEIKAAGETQWREIGQLISSESGAVSVPVILSKITSLRFTTEASWERSASQSTEQVIEINRLISINAPTMSSVGATIVISGSMQPLQADLVLSLEKFVAGKWIQVSTSTTDTLGQFSFSTVEKERGISRFRVTNVADDLFEASTTPIFAILVL